MDDLEKQSALLKEALEELRRSTVLSQKTLDKLTASINANTKANVNAANEIETTADKVSKFGKGVNNITRSIVDATNSIRQNREDFTSLNPAIRATGAAAGIAGKKLGGLVDATGQVVSSLGIIFGPKGLLVSTVLGGIISGVGKSLGYASDELAKLGVQFGEFSTNELQRLVLAFREIGSVGAIGAGGMGELYDRAIQAGLGVEQFAAIVSKQAKGIAFATGSTEKGAKQLAEIAEDFRATGFTTQLRKLGYTLTDQSEFTAKFLEQNRLATRTQITDRKQLAEASNEYLEQLDLLSRVTGARRDAVQSELDAQMNNVRFLATLQTIADKGVRDSLKHVGVVLSQVAGKEVAEGFQDAAGNNLGTEAARNFFQLTGGKGQAIIDDLINKRITQEEALAKIQAAASDRLASLGGAENVRRIGKLNTVLEPVLMGLLRLDKATNLTIENQQDAAESQKGAKNTQDKATKEVVKAQEALQEMAIQLDKMVRDKVFPNATASVKQFTEATLAFVEYANEKLGVGKPEPGGIDKRPFKRRVQEPEEFKPGTDVGKKIIQVESGGKNIPTAGNRSSAHGIAQMTKGTYEGLVKNAPKDSPLYGTTFADMKRDVNLQQVALDMLLDQNRKQLADAKVSTSDAALYLAHFLGARGAINVLKSSDTAAIQSAVGLQAMMANPGVFRGMNTVGDLKKWADMKMGGSGYQFGGVSSGPSSGYYALLHGTEAVVPLPDGRTIPVEMSGMSDKMGEQIAVMHEQTNKLEELIGLMRNNNDLSRGILSATTG